MEEGGWYGWQVGSAFFSAGEHSEIQGAAKDPGRLLFNFDTKEVKEEFERMKALGATVIKEPYEMQVSMWIATLADQANFLPSFIPSLCFMKDLRQLQENTCARYG